MRRAIASLLASLYAVAAIAAMAAEPQRADLFDFWLGDWDVSWTGDDGTRGGGRNRIAKILDGNVIEEQFEETPDGKTPPLRGRSHSVLHKASGQWRQSWVDNQGGYFSLTAQVDGERRIFGTDMAEEKAQRMVFHSIAKDSLLWDWEGTNDGGKTWKRLWRIEYKRRAR